jgi:hypothetical protein
MPILQKSGRLLRNSGGKHSATVFAIDIRPKLPHDLDWGDVE